MHEHQRSFIPECSWGLLKTPECSWPQSQPGTNLLLIGGPGEHRRFNADRLGERSADLTECSSTGLMSVADPRRHWIWLAVASCCTSAVHTHRKTGLDCFLSTALNSILPHDVFYCEAVRQPQRPACNRWFIMSSARWFLVTPPVTFPKYGKHYHLCEAPDSC